LDDKNSRKANLLERDVLEVVSLLFEEYRDGVIPFSEIWELLKDKTNGEENPNNKNKIKTESYDSIYKRSIFKMLRDKFGAKDPITRDAKVRSLVFDINKKTIYKVIEKIQTLQRYLALF